MRPHPHIRKAVMYGGAVLTVLLVVVWIGSAWWSLYCRTPPVLFSVVHGKIGILHGIGIGPLGVSPSDEQPMLTRERSKGVFDAVPRPRLYLWPEWNDARLRADLWYMSLPLWIPVAASLLITALAFRLDHLARRLARMNLCPTGACHYDRTGLAPDAVCPECGTAHSSPQRGEGL